MKQALLFPGQGAQNVGMGAALTARSQLARDLFQQASDILGYDLHQLCTVGPAEQLNRTEFSQPALFVHSFAALKQLEEEQPQLWDSVVCVAGLSLGEYTAVAAAGGMGFADGVKLVQVRGQAMQQAADQVASGMSSILGMEEDPLAEICRQVSSADSFVQVANLLCPGNIAISGHLPALEQAERRSCEAGAMRAIRLQVAGAFHTEIMRPAVATLAEALAAVTFRPTRVPVFSNVDAAPHREPSDVRDLLARQVVSPVRWEASLRNMLSLGLDYCTEIGTGKVLAGTLKRVQRKLSCDNYGDA